MDKVVKKIDNEVIINTGMLIKNVESLANVISLLVWSIFIVAAVFVLFFLRLS